MPVPLFRTATGKERGRVAFSPQGDTIATRSEDGSLVFWDTAAKKGDWLV